MKTIWQCKLDGRTLSFRKHNRSDTWGEWQETEIKDVSWFIRKPFFELIKKFIYHDLAGLDKNDDSFRPRARAVASGLRDLGKFLGLDVPESDRTTHLLWRCKTSEDKTVTLTDWRILDWADEDLHGVRAAKIADKLRGSPKPGDRFRRLEDESKAIMRDAIVIFKNGWALVPARTRQRDHD